MVGKQIIGPIALDGALRAEYEQLFASCVGRPEFVTRALNVVSMLLRNRSRYDAVASRLGIPWSFVACIHSLESGVDFHSHLHNGDPLTARTINVPAGRPPNGVPPFTWETSAIDALCLKGLNDWDDWTPAGQLYQFERYNGFGYRRRGVPSPYLWSGSQHYVKGKYVRDGKFDPETVSKQIGAGLLLRIMVSRGVDK